MGTKMKSINDIGRYRRAEARVKELEPLLDELDRLCEIVYNNLGNAGMWNILNVAEDVRIGYYLEHYECQRIVKNKGKVVYE